MFFSALHRFVAASINHGCLKSHFSFSFSLSLGNCFLRADTPRKCRCRTSLLVNYEPPSNNPAINAAPIMSADAPSVLSRDRIEGMLRGVVCILDAEDKTTTRNVHYSTGLPDEVVYWYKCWCISRNTKSRKWDSDRKQTVEDWSRTNVKRYNRTKKFVVEIKYKADSKSKEVFI